MLPEGMKPPNAGKRRPKGVPNKATAAVREAIAAFAEANVEKLQSRLDTIAEKHPDKAADLFLRALEYFTPKLVADLEKLVVHRNGG